MRKFYLNLICFLLFISGTAQQQWKTSDIKQIQNTLNQKLKNQFAETDLDSWVIQSDASSRNKNSWYYYITQTHNDIVVNNSVTVLLKVNNTYEVVNTRFVKNLESKINATNPTLSPEMAVLKALNHYGLTAKFSLKKIKSSPGVVTFERTDDLQSDIKVNLIYEPTKDGLVKLAWNVNLDFKDGTHWWNTRIDAVTGSFINDNDWVVSCGTSNEKAHNHKHNEVISKKVDFTSSVFNKKKVSQSLLAGSYRVLPYYIESPNHGDFELVTNPNNATASPNGWHSDGSTSYTNTRGNNIVAREDQNGNNGTDGLITNQSAAGLIFDYPYGGPSVAANTYVDASSTQLFYMANVLHDVSYKYGFDEASGNYQVTNFTGMGSGSDPVLVDVQEGSSLNGANFTPTPDGIAGRLQVYLFDKGAYNPPPGDNLVINNSPFAGIYNAIDNQFNPGHVTISSPLTADFVLVNDGTSETADACEAIVNAASLVGKIAVIRRGTCALTSKVLKAQNAGAVGVLVINNTFGEISMAGADASITIPAYSLNQVQGEQLISVMGSNTVNGTINPTPPDPVFVNIDNGFDNVVTGHEYAHGINIRLVGGRNNSGCVNAVESMGEGWADYIGKALMLKNIPNGISPNGVGTFLLGKAPNTRGIRPAAYSGNIFSNVMTYQTLIDDPTNAIYTVPHGVGAVWGGMLWDLTWDLIAVHGFTDDIYNAKGTFGNTIALSLVIEAMKLTACDPGFVDGRDAILKADDVLYGNGVAGSGTGPNQCIIWSAFARRGLGANASQGGNPLNPFDTGNASTSDGNADFTLPAALGCNPDFLIDYGKEKSKSICQGTKTETFFFVFYEQNGFDTATPFAVSGLPAGTTATFFPTTMKDTGLFRLTLSNIPTNTSGTFPLSIVPGGNASKAKSVDLIINASNPNLADGDTEFSTNNGSSYTSFSANQTVSVAPSSNLEIRLPDAAYQGTIVWTSPNGTTYTTNSISFSNVLDGDNSVEGSWSAQVSFTNDCIATLAPQTINFTVNIDPLLSVSDFSLNEISLYPNPTNDNVTINGLAKLQDVQVRVIDIMGRVLGNNVSVTSVSSNRKTLNMSQLSSGTYFVEVKSQEGKIIKKVVKN